MPSSEEGFLVRLRTSGIQPGDSDETRLQKSLLVFATGLISLASTLWLFIYWQFGPQFSATIPFIFQLLLIGNLVIYLKSRKFDRFRLTQLLTILCMPFAAQWGMGGFIDASGISLWGLLAPIGAALIIGARPSQTWFIAYVLLVVLSGIFDFFLAEGAALPTYRLSMQTMAFFFTLNFIAVSTLVYLMIRYATAEKQRVRLLLEEAHQRLQSAQARSERLLLNVLPSAIAERLKHETQTIADGFADVSVMFADIVDFTRMAEGMTPQQVFSMLNEIFSLFDELAEKYGMEKIKTIGDAYMVAGGMADDRCGNYTDALVDLALEMRNLLRQSLQTRHQIRLEVRIGISTGPVVAGVVGKKKFTYDLWGDTVNLASRITDEGGPGMVQVDETTYRRLRQRFDFDAPRTVFLQGKGNTTIYRVIGHKPSPVTS